MNGKKMQCQLVLQWPASSIKDYEDLIWIEDALIDGGMDVDGHDAGSGQVNIFIISFDPVCDFDLVKRVLGSKDFMFNLKAAYRILGEEIYHPIWPQGLMDFSML